MKPPVAVCVTLPARVMDRLPVWRALSPRLTSSGPSAAPRSMSSTAAFAVKFSVSSLKLALPFFQSMAILKPSSAATFRFTFSAPSSFRPMASTDAPKSTLMVELARSVSWKTISSPVSLIESASAPEPTPGRVGSQLAWR